MFENVQPGVGDAPRHLLCPQHGRHPVIATLENKRGHLYFRQVWTEIIFFAQRSHHVGRDIHIYQWIVIHLPQSFFLEVLVPVQRHDLQFEALQLGFGGNTRLLSTGDLAQFFLLDFMPGIKR